MYRCLFSSTIKPTTTRCKTLLRFQSTCTTSFSSKPFLGFVGLGQMGGPMAMNLHTAGHEMVIYDVVDSNLDILRSKKGIQVASHPREVAEKCHTIITMLPSTQIVQQVYLNKKEEGFFSALEKGQLLIDSSTIDPMFTKELSLKLHEEKQVFFVDAPVSGGINGAKNATLTFMVGGKKKEFELAKPFLKQMGKNIVHCGDTSTGQIAKVCNNLALGIEMVAVAEAMTLGVKLGIDPKVLAGIMNTSSSQCWSSSVYNPYPGVMEGVPSSNDYKGGFAVKLMRKDLGLAVDAAKNAEASVPLTSATHQLYNLMVNEGNGHKDFSFILKFLQGKN